MHSCKSYVTAILLVLALQGGLNAGVDGLQLSELPRNPDASCSWQLHTVSNAFLACKDVGVSQLCCSGIDKLFWDSGSSAAGCLCYPHVLYKLIEASRAEGLDALAVLDSCNQQHSMKTQWALKPHTTCPPTPFSTSPESLLLQLGGPEPILVPRGAPRATWAWRNLLQTGQLMANPALLVAVTSGSVLSHNALCLVFTVFCCIAPLYLILHKFMLRASPAYGRLDPGQRLVSCQHAVFLMVFTLQLLPQSILSVRCLFKAWTAEYVTSHEMQILVGFLVAMRAVLYIVEACIRSVVRFSGLLLVHHQLYFVVLISAIWTLNVPAFMMGLVLDWMACLEVPLYLALLAYRLEFPSKLARFILVSACGWYVITRVLQTIMLVYMIVGWVYDPAVSCTPAFILTSLMCGAFTVIQAYTIVIYRGIWSKLAEACSSFSYEKGGQLSRGSSTEDLVCDVSLPTDDCSLNKPLILGST